MRLFIRVFAVPISIASAIRRPLTIINQVVPFTGGSTSRFLTFTSTSSTSNSLPNSSLLALLLVSPLVLATCYKYIAVKWLLKSRELRVLLLKRLIFQALNRAFLASCSFSICFQD